MVSYELSTEMCAINDSMYMMLVKFANRTLDSVEEDIPGGREVDARCTTANAASSCVANAQP